ncbi:hypothetical protein ACP4OV_028067 [Aristida adscensionis]
MKQLAMPKEEEAEEEQLPLLEMKEEAEAAEEEEEQLDLLEEEEEEEEEEEAKEGQLDLLEDEGKEEEDEDEDEDEEEEEKEEEEEDLDLLEEEEMQEHKDSLFEPPDWLPDGWIMEIYHTEKGTIKEYFISPVSSYTFEMRSDVLKYLFAGVDERLLESKKEFEEKKILQRSHEWLPKGWVMEIRAGGKKMDKMYKFYIHAQTGVRMVSREEVALYVKESKIPKCDTDEHCDTSSKDNLLAIVELNPTGLPYGWVKEEAFRKTKEGGIRKDPYYTDHVSGYTFRTLKSALSYLETGEVSKRAFIQTISVHDRYSFDRCTDLHESLRSRLCMFGQNYRRPAQQKETSQTKLDGNRNSYR